MSDPDNSPVPAKAAPYQVLARKYRPQRFEDLIGHGAMVRTLKNAFASDRIAHAYILTGVRGVGKTTTARILARALNYVGTDGEDNGPQMEMAEEGRHCKAIAESRHPDVLEMDAASRTGVGDIRELIEGVRYAPIEARYKVYIIDEVHMLSTAAFNALLKTLEEPPPHVKFIFATTEIRKLPVTVLSRCQRFDLRRIDPETLTDHLGNIAGHEGVSIARDGLWMIARAAEGSVRDGLSILDQAIVQHKAQSGKEPAGSDEIGPDAVRDMLGLADRTLVWDLLDACLKGDAKTALDAFASQYDAGAEPSVVLRDMLDIVHLLTRVKAAGPEASAHGPAGEADAERAKAMANGLELNALTRAWALLMKGLGETNIAPDPAAAGEMALIRLCFAADLPTPDEALRALKKNSSNGVRAPSAPTKAEKPQSESPRPAPVAEASRPPSAQIINIDRPLRRQEESNPSVIGTFEDVTRLAGRMRDKKLRTELEAYVHILAFEEGRIEMRLGENAPPDLPGRLTKQLKDWTGRQWLVSVTQQGGGAKAVRDQRLAEVLADPLVKKALELFPGAEVTSVKEAEAPIEPAPDELEEEPPIDPDDDVYQEDDLVLSVLREQTDQKKG